MTPSMGAIGSGILTVGVGLSAFCTSLLSFALCYGVLFGVGVGLAYSVPLMVSWGHYPQHRARVTGLLMAFFTYGVTFFSLLSTYVINPENEKSTLRETNGLTTHYYFREEIARKVPNMLLTLAGCYSVLTLLGVLLISNKPNKGGVPEPATVTSKDLTSWTFLCLHCAAFLSLGFSMYVSCAYKVYGNTLFNDDYYLAIVGSVTALINGTSRFLWAEAMQRFGFKAVYIAVLVAQILTSGSLPLLSSSKVLYFLCITLAFVNQGAHFVLFPAVCAEMYGRTKGAVMFAILYIEFGLSAFSAFLLQKYAVADIGYSGMFYLLTAAATVSLVLAITFTAVKEGQNPLQEQLIVKPAPE